MDNKTAAKGVRLSLSRTTPNNTERNGVNQYSSLHQLQQRKQRRDEARKQPDIFEAIYSSGYDLNFEEQINTRKPKFQVPPSSVSSIARKKRKASDITESFAGLDVSEQQSRIPPQVDGPLRPAFKLPRLLEVEDGDGPQEDRRTRVNQLTPPSSSAGGSSDSTTSGAVAPSSRSFGPENNTESATPTSTNDGMRNESLGVGRRRRRTPPVCACQKETHARPRTKSETASNDEDSEAEEDTGIADETTERNAPDLLKERAAKMCERCHSFKKPPKGKKFAWRERSRKWMYVHEDAAEEDDYEVDRDDEELLPAWLSPTLTSDTAVKVEERTNSEYIREGPRTEGMPSQESSITGAFVERVNTLSDNVQSSNPPQEQGGPVDGMNQLLATLNQVPTILRDLEERFMRRQHAQEESLQALREENRQLHAYINKNGQKMLDQANKRIDQVQVWFTEKMESSA